MGENLLRRAGKGNGAVLHYHQLLRLGGSHVHVVGHQHDGAAGGTVVFGDVFQYGAASGRVKAGDVTVTPPRYAIPAGPEPAPEP